MPVYSYTKTVVTTEEVYAEDKNQAKAILQSRDKTAIITDGDLIKIKKIDDEVLDMLSIGDISFQDFLDMSRNTYVTKARKKWFIKLLEENTRDYNLAYDCIDFDTIIKAHPEKQGQKDITILEIIQRTRNKNTIEDTFFITLLDKYKVNEDIYP